MAEHALLELTFLNGCWDSGIAEEFGLRRLWKGFLGIGLLGVHAVGEEKYGSSGCDWSQHYFVSRQKAMKLHMLISFLVLIPNVHSDFSCYAWVKGYIWAILSSRINPMKFRKLPGKNVPRNSKFWCCGLQNSNQYLFLPGTSSVAFFRFFSFAHRHCRKIYFACINNSLSFMSAHSYCNTGHLIMSHKVFRAQWLPWLTSSEMTLSFLYDLLIKHRFLKKTSETKCCH